jgi:predicted nucleic acid-binding protein
VKVFFDTSALVKRYIEESGSEKVIEVCKQADLLVISIICLPEMISTLNRLVREGALPAGDYQRTKNLILEDLEDVEICNLTPDVISRAMGCLESHPLRAMDALHLGCALAVNPDLFISSDQRQIEASRSEGLNVIEV